MSNTGLAQYTGYLVNAPPAPERNAVSVLERTGSGCATAIFTTNPAGTLEDFDSSNGVQRTYLYSAADGNATLSDEGGDSAVILTDVASTDVKLWLVADGSGEDVAIEIEATSQILTLVGAGNPSGNNDFSGLTFADGVTLSGAQLATAATTYHWTATAGGLTLPALLRRGGLRRAMLAAGAMLRLNDCDGTASASMAGSAAGCEARLWPAHHEGRKPLQSGLAPCINRIGPTPDFIMVDRLACA